MHQECIDIMYMFRMNQTTRHVYIWIQARIQDQTWRGPLNWSSPTFHSTDEKSEALEKYILQFFPEKSPRVNVPQKEPLSMFWFIFFHIFFLKKRYHMACSI